MQNVRADRTCASEKVERSGTFVSATCDRGERFVLRELKDKPVVRAADDVDAFVGSRVRIRRMTLGISQEHLGAALGLTFQQVQKYEKGQNRIGAGRLFRIAQILSVPVQYFYEGLPATIAEDEEGDVAERTASVQAFLASNEGHALSMAFLKIEDVPTRRRIVDLVNTIAKGAG